MQYLEIALLTFLVLCSILTIFTRKLLSAVILFSGFSLILSILWLFMESPDLGITEAAVGAGITSILFFIVLRNINAMHLHDEESDLPEMIAKNVHGWYTGNDEDVDLIAKKEEIRESVEGLKTPLTTKKALFRNNILSIAVSVAIVIIMLAIVKDMPKYGDPQGPVVNEVLKEYVEEGLQKTGAVNIVAGIILDYRAFDTFGESMMLFTSTMAVVALLKQNGKKKKGDHYEKN